jgi:hypothetical protein
MMLRSEVIRGRFRDSFEDPKAFEPGVATKVRLELLDVPPSVSRKGIA